MDWGQLKRTCYNSVGGIERQGDEEEETPAGFQRHEVVGQETGKMSRASWGEVQTSTRRRCFQLGLH